MTQLKAAPLGLALGFLSVLMANAANLPPPMAYPVDVPPPAFTWADRTWGRQPATQMAFTASTTWPARFWDILACHLTKAGASPRAERLGIILSWQSCLRIKADLSWLNNKSTYVDPNGAINIFTHLKRSS